MGSVSGREHGVRSPARQLGLAMVVACGLCGSPLRGEGGGIHTLITRI